jgi:hypothetical protein
MKNRTCRSNEIKPAQKEKSVSAPALNIDFMVAVIATDMHTWLEAIQP